MLQTAAHSSKQLPKAANTAQKTAANSSKRDKKAANITKKHQIITKIVTNDSKFLKLKASSLRLEA